LAKRQHIPIPTPFAKVGRRIHPQPGLLFQCTVTGVTTLFEHRLDITQIFDRTSACYSGGKKKYGE